MTPRSTSSSERDLEILIAATASAHAAGVCGSLLRDRIEARYDANPGADLVAAVRPGQFARILATAERFKEAVLAALHDLEPGARVTAANIAGTAHDSARAALLETLQHPLGADRGATRQGGLR
jgi:hypothetical protein